MRERATLRAREESLAAKLEEAATLAIGSGSRKRLEERILEETEVTNFAQLATFAEILAYRAGKSASWKSSRPTPMEPMPFWVARKASWTR